MGLGWGRLRDLLARIVVNVRHEREATCYDACGSCQARREARGLIEAGIHDPVRLVCEEWLRRGPTSTGLQRFRAQLREALNG